MNRYYFENAIICGNCNGSGLQSYMDYCRACKGEGLESRAEFVRNHTDKLLASIEYNNCLNEILANIEKQLDNE